MTEQEELQLSPAEERLLRRFFHRHALPYAVITIAVAGLAGALTHALSGSDAAPGGEAGAISPADLASFETTRTAAEELLTELRQLARRDDDWLAEVERRMSSVERRVAGARERIDEVEAATAAARVAGPPAVGAGAPADLNSLLERLHELEVRQERMEARSADSDPELTRAVEDPVERVHEPGERTAAGERAELSEAPAAPDPADAP